MQMSLRMELRDACSALLALFRRSGRAKDGREKLKMGMEETVRSLLQNQGGVEPTAVDPLDIMKAYRNSKIRASNIKIRTLESRPLTVTLDRDCRRSYTNVQSIEISPCLDPGYSVQKTIRSKFKLGEDKEGGLSKYMNRGLQLPINTFAGIIT